MTAVRLRPIAPLLALSLVAGCGNVPGARDELTAVSAIFTATRASLRPTDGPKPHTSVITGGTPAQVKEVIAPLPGRLKALIVLKTNESAVLFDVGGNGPYHHWATPSGQILTLRGGVLVATRGLGYDLMSAEADGSARLIRERRLGNTDKVLRYLDGEDDEVPMGLKCTVSNQGPESVRLATGETRAATKMRETCISGRLTLNNFYWVDARGDVVQSRQWGGEEIGEVVIQSLRD